MSVSKVSSDREATNISKILEGNNLDLDLQIILTKNNE